MNKNEHQPSRRDFLKKAAYTAPVILTLTSVPAFATYGSHCRQGSKPKVSSSYTRGSKRVSRSYTQGSKRVGGSYTRGSKRIKVGSSHGKPW
jgi:hypothetical protein